MANALQGKLIGITIDEDFVKCQTDATLTVTVNTTTTDPCKPEPTDTTDGASWEELTEDSKSWSIAFSAKAFADTVKANQADILQKLVNGSARVTATFATTKTTDYGHPEIQLFNGDGIISEFTWNAPSQGESTYDVTINGTGKPTFTRTANP